MRRIGDPQARWKPSCARGKRITRHFVLTGSLAFLLVLVLVLVPVPALDACSSSLSVVTSARGTLVTPEDALLIDPGLHRRTLR